MATADLGIRIFLQDGASSGLGALNLGMGRLGYQIGYLSNLWGGLSDTMKTSVITTGAAGVVFAGFASALGYVIDQGETLQDALVRVSIAVKGADQNSQALNDTLINVANNSKFTSSQVADGFVMLGEKTLTATDIINGAGVAMVNLAQATHSQTVPAAELLGSVLKEFNLNASDAAHTADLLTGAFYNGQPSISGLQAALMKVAATADELHIPLADVITALDILGQAGFSGAQAGTALYNMLKNLTDPTLKAESALASLGVTVVNSTSPALIDLYNKVNNLESTNSHFDLDNTVESLKKVYDGAKKFDILATDDSFYTWALKNGFISSNFFTSSGDFVGLQNAIDQLGLSILKLPPDQRIAKIQDIFNVRGSQGVGILVNDLAQIDPLWKSIHDSLENTDTASDAAKITGTLSGSIQRLATTFQDLAGRIGLTVTPLSGFINKISDFLGNLTLHHPTLLKWIGTFLVLGTVISGITFVILFIVTAIGLLIASGLGELIVTTLLVIANLVTLAAVGAWIASMWDKISAALKPVVDWFKWLGGILREIFMPMMSDLGKALESQVNPTIQQMGGFISATLVPAWNQFIGALKDAQPVWDFLLQALKWIGIVLGVLVGGVLAVAVGAIVGIIAGLVNGLKFLLTGLASFFSGAITVIVGFISLIIHVFGLVLGFFSDWITQGWDKALKNLSNNWSKVWNDIINIVKGVGLMLYGILIGVFGTIIGAIAGFITGFIKFFQHLWDILFGHSIMIDIQNAFHAVFNFIGNIFLGFYNFAIAPFLGYLNTMWKGIQTIIGGISNGWNSFFDGVGKGLNIVIGYFDKFANAVRGSLHSILGPVETVLQGLANIPLVGGVFNGVLNVLRSVHFAQGGIVSRPTYALIGEGGESEVIVPVSKMIAAAQLAMMQTQQTNNQSNGGVVNVILDGKVIGQAALDALRHDLRMNGFGRVHR